MTAIVVEDDRILRTLAALLGPPLAADHLAALNDYVAHDGFELALWRERTLAGLPALRDVELRYVADTAALHAALPGACAVVVESLPIGAAELARGDRLRIVIKFGTLTHNIDAAACAARGVPVVPVRRRTNRAVAEHAIAGLLALVKRFPALAGRVTAAGLAAAGLPYRPYDARHGGNNNYGRAPGLRNLSDLTVGILGFGEIGREMARLLRGFEARVLVHQRRPLPPAVATGFGVEYRSCDDLFAESDALLVQLPVTAATRGYVNARLIARMKRGALLINVARAAIVEREALIDALRSGQLGGAALDVHYDEPVRDDDALCGMPNVLLTPHVAGGSRANVLADLEAVARAVQSKL